MARALKKAKASLGEDVLGGRPEKAEIVKKWRKSHPEGTKADCVRETGLTKPTVYKWW